MKQVTENKGNEESHRKIRKRRKSQKIKDMKVTENKGNESHRKIRPRKEVTDNSGHEESHLKQGK